MTTQRTLGSSSTSSAAWKSSRPSARLSALSASGRLSVIVATPSRRSRIRDSKFIGRSSVFIGSSRTAGTRSQTRLACGCGSHCGPATSCDSHDHVQVRQTRRRASCEATSRISWILSGFTRTRSTPCARRSSAESSTPKPVTTMTGTAGAISLIARATCHPDTRGIARSVKTTSNGSAPKRAIPSLPSVTTTARCPPVSSTSPSIAPTVGSSSTTRQRSETSPDGGAAPLLAVDRDPRAVPLEDGIGHGQPEPRPLRPLGREERVEDPVADRRGDADAGIAHRDDDLAVHDGGRERQHAAAGHRVHRVEDQVRQRLAELDGVAGHLRERREIVLHLEHDAAAHGLLAPARLRDLERLAHHLVQVNGDERLVAPDPRELLEAPGRLRAVEGRKRSGASRSSRGSGATSRSSPLTCT